MCIFKDFPHNNTIVRDKYQQLGPNANKRSKYTGFSHERRVEIHILVKVIETIGNYSIRRIVISVKCKCD